MPQRDQHTAREQGAQACADQCWEELVQQRLPANLETQARTLGAFQRVRALPNAQALLRALLSYVLSLTSLKQLSGWSRLVGLTSRVITAQAWHTRLQRCGPWLLWLCNALLDLRLKTTALPTGQRLLLVDATFLTQMGKRGDLWRLHSAYDLSQGMLAWLEVSDRSLGESFANLPIQPGDVLVADKAYSKAPQLIAVDEAQGFSLACWSPWHLPVWAPEAPASTPEYRIDVQGWLTGLRPGIYERRGTVIASGKRLPVRLIAVVLPEEQAEARRRQAARQAREKGRKISEQSLLFAGFHLVVTTLPEKRWPTTLVLELYRCRWQIEILFKRMKQVLDAHRLPCRCSQTAQAMIAALLVGWLLIEEETTELRRQITEGEPLALPLSPWQLNQWAQASLHNVVTGWWSPHQVRALARELRPLFDHKRRRPLLEHQRQVRFHAVLVPEADLIALFDCSSA